MTLLDCPVMGAHGWRIVTPKELPLNLNILTQTNMSLYMLSQAHAVKQFFGEEQ